MINGEDEARSYCAGLCDNEAMIRLEELAEALPAENARQNLIAKPTEGSIWQRHIADSLQLLEYVPRETPAWLDLGSGAGFPGLALAIARPNQDIVLVESRRKRIDWLRSMVARFELANCRVEGSRLENVDSFESGVITARAFAPLVKLLKLSARFSTPDTVWLLPKGRSAAQELQEQPAKVQKMFHVEQSRTDAEAMILVGKGQA